ncbi:MAG: M48 family metallopeptidase [Candidatus Krumholzibacteriia bacterium]
MRMRGVIPLLAVCLLVSSCATVPITGRKQLSLVPASQMMATSYQQYDEFLKSNKLSTDARQTAMVQSVGRRVQGAVEQYFAQQGQAQRLADYRWEFNLVESPEVNAWCMPGGKVVVYSGLLPVAQNEAGLAVVVGHEIAHAIADHGGERMSQQLLAQFGGMALDTALQSKPDQTRQLWMGVYGAGAQYGVLMPFSRQQESEADRLGLVFMAMAGYDPHEAVTFWTRMAAASGGQKPPEFMSTHPSDATRIADLNRLLPEAMAYYKPRP